MRLPAGAVPPARTALTVVLALAVVVMAGCSAGSAPRASRPASATRSPVTVSPSTGGTSVSSPTACPRVPRTVFGSTVTAARIDLSAGVLKCGYRAVHAARRACTAATVVIDTAPQALWTFRRWTVETGQNAMWTNNPALSPRPVGGIGIEGEWVPATTTFETASATTWVAVFLDCPSGAVGALRLGKSLARIGLAAAP
jgi:hypothetical protein